MLYEVITHAALELVQRQGLKLGLATSSPMRLVEAVLARLQIADSFAICHSAEFERYGKPHPAVYLTAAEKLGVAARDCLAIEDSFNGLLAAKSAGMQAVIIPRITSYNVCYTKLLRLRPRKGSVCTPDDGCPGHHNPHL